MNERTRRQPEELTRCGVESWVLWYSPNNSAPHIHIYGIPPVHHPANPIPTYSLSLSLFSFSLPCFSSVFSFSLPCFPSVLFYLCTVCLRHHLRTMNSNSNNTSNPPQSQSMAAPSDSSANKKVRKPYTITKSRESWSEEEHDKFLEALQLFDRDWKKIEDFVGSKTVIQIRSHAQKYFLKVQKNGTMAHVPPPRPKRKATHPYPQKASKNVLMPLPASMAYASSTNTIAPGYVTWDESSMLINPGCNKSMSCQDELTNLHGNEADIRSKGMARISSSSLSGVGSSSRMVPVTEMQKHGTQTHVLHGLPDFAEVYSFIGSIFDPETRGHVQKLKEMDPINFETVLLLMKNLTVNLSSPNFEPIKEAMSSYDVNTKTAGMNVKKQTNNNLSCQPV